MKAYTDPEDGKYTGRTFLRLEIDLNVWGDVERLLEFLDGTPGIKSVRETAST